MGAGHPGALPAAGQPGPWPRRQIPLTVRGLTPGLGLVGPGPGALI